MGTDKGLLPLEESPAYSVWSERGLVVLRELGLDVILSINAAQEKSYPSVFPGQAYIVDREPDAGPLRGILSVHELHPTRNLLVLACDMIKISSDTLRLLLDAFREAAPGHEAAVFRVGERLEPLCALYTPELLARAGSLTAPRKLLSSARVLELDGEARRGEFAAFNSRDQIP